MTSSPAPDIAHQLEYFRLVIAQDDHDGTHRWADRFVHAWMGNAVAECRLLTGIKGSGPSQYYHLTKRVMAYHTENGGLASPEEPDKLVKPAELSGAPKCEIQFTGQPRAYRSITRQRSSRLWVFHHAS